MLLEQIRTLQEELNRSAWKAPAVVEAPSLVAETIAKIYELEEPRAMRKMPINFGRSKKPRKQMLPRKHRTRKEPFADAWPDIQLRLQLDPTRTAKDLLKQLIEENPEKYQINQGRTLQRRIPHLHTALGQIRQLYQSYR